jgi:hypothetical protein
MAELLSFLPLIVLGILGGHLPRPIAFAIGFGAAVVAAAAQGLRGDIFHFQIALLAVLTAVGLGHALAADIAERWSGVVIGGGLAAFALASVALGRPFTVDWAYQRVDPALWTHPTFLQVNVDISLVWGAIFLVQSVVALPMLRRFGRPWHRSVAHLGLIAAGIWFSNWHPSATSRG